MFSKPQINPSKFFKMVNPRGVGILDSSIHVSPLSVDIKCRLLKEFWDIDIDPLDFYEVDSDFDPYFKVYSEKCNSALYNGGRHLSVRTHQEIVDIARELKHSTDRDNIKNILKGKLTTRHPNEDELVDASIDLTMRLVLMLDFGIVRYGFTGRAYSAWKTGNIKSFISNYYQVPLKLGDEGLKLQENFNARNLGRIAGIKIDWTNNLADHLRLKDNDKTVAIFHYKSFLDAQTKK